MFKKKPFFVIFEGIEGSGKSFQARKLHQNLKKNKYSTILTREPGGTKNAERIRNICILLDKNNINVIVSVLSIFPDMLLWNRKNFKKYFEVFLNPKFETLISRDVKGLYKNAKNRKIKNIVGIDIKFHPPKNQI